MRKPYDPGELTQTKSDIMSVQDLRGKPPIFYAVKGPVGARLKGYHFRQNMGKGVCFQQMYSTFWKKLHMVSEKRERVIIFIKNW